MQVVSDHPMTSNPGKVKVVNCTAISSPAFLPALQRKIVVRRKITSDTILREVGHTNKVGYEENAQMESFDLRCPENSSYGEGKQEKRWEEEVGQHGSEYSTILGKSA